MNDADRSVYQARYRTRLAEYGVDPRTLGWTKGKQQERFAAAVELLPIDQLRSVLDVGCGFGDFFPFLRSRGFSGTYTGIDFVPELIEQARLLHREGEFVAGDFEQMELGNYDLVAASGIFNARLMGEDQAAYIRRTLEKMFRHAKTAVAADFLSTLADQRRDDLYYSDPLTILDVAQGLTRRCALLQHYLPFEFCVLMFVDDRVDETVRFAPLARSRTEA